MRRTPRPAILRMASPTRAPRLGAIAPSSFTLSPSVATFEALARCSAPSPNARSFSPWSKVNAPATARRPTDGIAMPRPALRAIAPSRIAVRCEKAPPFPPVTRIPPPSGTFSSRAERCALSRSTRPPLSLAHRSLEPSPPGPMPRSRRSSLRSRKRSIAASRSGFGRMAEVRISAHRLRLDARLIDRSRHEEPSSDEKAFSRIAWTTDLRSPSPSRP